MKPLRSRWTREQLLVAFALCCRLPFGQLHHRNPCIINVAAAVGRTPSALAMKLVNIAALDPAVTSTGRRGLSGASAKGRAMWREMEQDWASFAVACEQALAVAEGKEGLLPGVEPEARRDGRDRIAPRKVRIGQRFFRTVLLSAYGGRCCISGLSVPDLLVASHIVPWREDADNRANPRNGLLLSALHDSAFDQGWITVEDDLTIRVSEDMAGSTDPFLDRTIAAYNGRRIRPPEKFRPDGAFLAYHRHRVFRG